MILSMSSTTPIENLFAEASRLDTTVHEALESQVRPLGLSVPQSRILERIGDSPMTVASLARRLDLARQSVQRVADLLVRDGLARLDPNPDHKRAKLLAPTDAGRLRLEELRAAEGRWLEAVRSDLPRQITDPKNDINPAIELMRLVRETIESNRPLTRED